jgi:hypothetical protein
MNPVTNRLSGRAGSPIPAFHGPVQKLSRWSHPSPVFVARQPTRRIGPTRDAAPNQLKTFLTELGYE